MRNAPGNLRTVNRDDLMHLYKSKAVQGSLMSQWYGTIQGFLGHHSASASTAEYRVAPDYGLVAEDRVTGARYSEPWSFQKRPSFVRTESAEKAASAGGQPFPVYTLSARDGRTEARIEKWARDLGLIRASSNVSAPAPKAKEASRTAPFIGDSLAPSMPGLDPIARGIDATSMPGLEPIASGVNTASIPSLEPIASGVSTASVPSLIPIATHIGDPPSLEPLSFAEESPTPSLVNIADLTPPSAVAIETEIDEEFPVYPSVSNVASLPVRSLASDPLAAELAKQVLAEKNVYSGVFVPSPSIFPYGERRAAAADLAAMPDEERARQIKPYLMVRQHTNHTIQALLAGEETRETGVVAANMKPWSVQTRADGTVHVRNHAQSRQSQAEMYRIKEHPAAIMIYTNVPCKEGQK